MTPQALCIGNALLDLYFHLEDTPAVTFDQKNKTISIPAGSKIPVSRGAMKLGGCAAHVGIGLSRLGITTAVAGETGNDGIGQWMKDLLIQEGLDTSLFTFTDRASASFAAVLDVSHERTEFVHHEVREHAVDLSHVTPEWIYLGSVGEEWEGLYEHVSEKVKNENIKFLCNPGSLQLEAGVKSLSLVLSTATVFVVNKEEAYKLTQIEKLDDSREKKELSEALLAYGPKTVVITDGESGSWSLNTDGEFHEQEAISVVFQEKTGAGDGFVAGLLGALILEKSIEDALLWGALDSASCVANGGCAEGLMHLTAMEKAVIKQKTV